MNSPNVWAKKGKSSVVARANSARNSNAQEWSSNKFTTQPSYIDGGDSSYENINNISSRTPSFSSQNLPPRMQSRSPSLAQRDSMQSFDHRASQLPSAPSPELFSTYPEEASVSRTSSFSSLNLPPQMQSRSPSFAQRGSIQPFDHRASQLPTEHSPDSFSTYPEEESASRTSSFSSLNRPPKIPSRNPSFVRRGSMQPFDHRTSPAPSSDNFPTNPIEAEDPPDYDEVLRDQFYGRRPSSLSYSTKNESYQGGFGCMFKMLIDETTKKTTGCENFEIEGSSLLRINLCDGNRQAWIRYGSMVGTQIICQW